MNTSHTVNKTRFLLALVEVHSAGRKRHVCMCNFQCVLEKAGPQEVCHDSSKGTNASTPAVRLQLAKGQMNALHLPKIKIKRAVSWLGKRLARQKR